MTEGTRRRDVVVREPRVEDAEAVATAHVRAWQVGYRGILPDGVLDRIDLAARIERWHGWLADGAFRRTKVRVAEVDGTVVGFAIYGPERVPDEPAEPGTPSSGIGELYALNVHPDHWGRGAGAALLTFVRAALADAGHAEAILWVLPGNTRGRRFYEHDGWAADGAAKTEEIDGATVEEIRYRRPLG